MSPLLQQEVPIRKLKPPTRYRYLLYLAKILTLHCHLKRCRTRKCYTIYSTAQIASWHILKCPAVPQIILCIAIFNRYIPRYGICQSISR